MSRRILSMVFSLLVVSQAAAQSYKSGDVERVFEKKGNALVTAGFRMEGSADVVPLPESVGFRLVLADRELTALDFQSAEPVREGEDLLIAYSVKDLLVKVRHSPGPTAFTTRKRIEVENRGERVLSVKSIHLEDFAVGDQTEGGGRGQPFILGGRVFLGMEHPSAEQIVEKDRAFARHSPSKGVHPGGRLVSKVEVVGIAPKGRVDERFDEYIRAIMHRPKKFVWVYNTWGAHDHLGLDKAWLDEKRFVEIVDALERLHKGGVRFDYFQIDAGLDGIQNSLLKFHPGRVPKWLPAQLKRVRDMGMKPGVWTEMNKPFTGPYGAEWNKALMAAVKEHHVRILKLDFCGWTGATGDVAERNADLLFEMLDRAREVAPEFLVVAFNGINLSPWWLTHFDTQYVGDPKPSEWPTLRLKQSCHLYADVEYHNVRRHRYPWTTIDDCGVLMGKKDTIYWLGIEDWRDNLVMTLGRGTRIPFLYGGIDEFRVDDVEFLKRMQDLAKVYDDALGNVRPILGRPERLEVYGYANFRGRNRIIVLSNPSFKPRVANIKLDESIGLDVGMETHVDVSMLYPQEGLLQVRQEVGDTFKFPMRPFEVVLLSVWKHMPTGGDTLAGRNRPEIDPNAYARIKCSLNRADWKGKDRPPKNPNEGHFEIKRAYVGSVDIPALTTGKAIAFPLNGWEYKQTRAALRVEGETIWMGQTPRVSTLRVWSGCGWTTFHATLKPEWRGKNITLIVASNQERKEKELSFPVYIMAEPPPAP